MNSIALQARKLKNAHARSRFVKEFKKHWQFYVIILLPLLQIIIFKYIPMIGISLAFEDFRPSKGIWGSPWVGLKHFERFFTSPSTLSVISNTIIISIYSIAASFPFAILLAISLNEAKSVIFKKTVQMVTYLPYFISTVVMVAMLMQFLDPSIGIVNVMIRNFGGQPQNFMGNPLLFKSLYVWSGVWQSTGYNAIIYLAALTGINPELHESAIVDGASKLRRIWHIDLPGITPTIVILLIINVGYIMSVGFEKVYLMQNPMNLDAGEVISTYVYRIGLISTDFSFSTAIGLFNSVVNMILLIGVNFLAKRYSNTSLW